MNLNFEQIIILGSGSFATNCILHMIQLDIPVIIYESNTTKITTLEHMANQNGIKYINLEKKEIFLELVAVRKKTLMFLLGCNYVIPSEVICNKNLCIVNYHNSLLPKHPGRNAEAWAIFDQDTTTGITWHLVDEKIDAGDIIIQREIPIDESISSIALLRLQNQLAFDSFKLIIKDLLEGNTNCFKQNLDLRGRLHLSNDIPNNGFLDKTWDINKIRAFLRSVDYGALRTMGQPKIIYNDNTYTWKKTSYFDVDTEVEGIIYNEEEKYILIIKNRKAVKLMNAVLYK